jgi:hypothetical protein
MSSKPGELRSRPAMAAAAAMLLVVAACVGPVSSISPSTSPAGRSSAAAPVFGSSAPSTIGAASVAPVATMDLENLPAAPNGAWKGIRWAELSTSPMVALQTPAPSISVGTLDSADIVAGWSRGYVSLLTQVVTPPDTYFQGTATIATTYSSDGVHWHSGNVLQQQIASDNLKIIEVYEGPSGLLAVGESGACGTGWIEALWTSRDGIAWQKVDTKKAFGKATIENVSGGSSGFVATDQTGHAVWTSLDGQSWRPVNLNASTFAHSRIDDGTAISGGYVLAGSTQLIGARSCGGLVYDPSVRPTPTPPQLMPAVWWSADGVTWTKSQLPGATSAVSIQMTVCRVNDRTVIAFVNQSDSLWITNDGRTWTASAQLSTALAQPSGLSRFGLLTDGRHGILVGSSHTNPNNAWNVSDISMVNDDGTLANLAQSGVTPPYGGAGTDANVRWVVGPTGILAIGESTLWIGLPS